MPSPFPGMNPLLERPAIWLMFHNNYLNRLQRELAVRLPDRYYVKAEVAIFLHEPAADERRRAPRPDLTVTTLDPATSGTATEMLAAPWSAMLPEIDEEEHMWLEIVDIDDNRLVTVIELLSPANKAGGSNVDIYEQKRLRLVREGVNLLEIDLLRAGGRMPMTNTPPGDYCIMIARREDRPRLAVWPIRLRERLPEIPLPLDPESGSIQLDLQQILHEVHDEAGYARWLYRDGLEKVVPPLLPEDQAWFVEQIRGMPA